MGSRRIGHNWATFPFTFTMGIPPWCWERLKAKGEKRAAEGEMVRQHHRLNGHASEQTPGGSGRHGTQRTQELGVLQSAGAQRVRHGWERGTRRTLLLIDKVFKNWFIYFNWRLITLLWWLLLYTDMNQPWVYMCSPPWTPRTSLSSHPSGSSQHTSPEHPVSCIEPGLAICFTYGNIHVSVPFSQIIPPSPSPTKSKTLFFNLCLFWCLSYRVIVRIFVNSIYMR